MAFPVFSPGDVLNASDMNAVGMWVEKSRATFTTASAVNVDDVFSADYRNYLLALEYTTSSTNNVTLQLRVGGVAASTNYNEQALSAASTTVQGARSTSQSQFIVGYSTNGNFISSALLWIFRPALAEPTGFLLTGGENFGAFTVPTLRLTSGNHSTATAYDGFGLAVAGGQTTTGSYVLYGLRD